MTPETTRDARFIRNVAEQLIKSTGERRTFDAFFDSGVPMVCQAHPEPAAAAQVLRDLAASIDPATAGPTEAA